MPGLDRAGLSDKAGRYSSIKYGLAAIEIIYCLLALFLFQLSGLSKFLAQSLSTPAINHFLVIPLYSAIIYIAYSLLFFPLDFYRSFVLERKFSLSNQKAGDWFLDRVKAGAISYIVALLLIEAFYYLFRHYPHIWWLAVSLFWIFCSLILARLTPVLIIPLFFKYKKLSDDALKKRVLELADKMQIELLGVFEIDFSRKTLKGNAAFLGWGRSKRVILGDTLKDKYTYDEITVILAHEFAHYKLRHLLKLITVNSLFVILAFYLIFKTSGYPLSLFGLSSLSDIASLPLVLIYFVIFGVITQPFSNFISRRLERNADMLALKVTGLKEAFISMMDKLSCQNLADRSPHPLIKFFFFDHPPVDERIAGAESFSV